MDACGSTDGGPYFSFQGGGKGIFGGHIPVIKQMTFFDTDLGNEQGNQMSKTSTRLLLKVHLSFSPMLDILVISKI